MHPTRPPSSRGAALCAAALALAAAAPTRAQQGPHSPAEAGARTQPTVTTEGFRALRWLAGDWRGRMADGTAFYERYTAADDSTIQVQTFGGDSTFAGAGERDSIALRAGAVRYGRAVVTRLEPRRVEFAQAPGSPNGFTFVRTGSERWTATIRGPSRTVVYAMERAAPRRTPGPAAPAPRPPRSLAADRDAVRRAVLDYVEGFYEGDTAKLARSVWPEVRKYGYARGAGGYRGMAMAFPAGFMGYAEGVRSGRTKTPPGAPKEIALFDVQDQTASAKLTAWWGTDYLLLAKEGGRWMITHVLWQSAPPAAR